MKKLFLTILLICASAWTGLIHAADVVYLLNGSIIRGTIIEMNKGRDIKIETADGSILVYQMSEVDHIDVDHNSMRTVDDEPQSASNYLKRGFRGIADVGLHIGMDNVEDNYMFSAAFTAGYQLSRTVMVGGGVAPTLWREPVPLDYYWYDEDYHHFHREIDRKNHFVLPIYAAVRLDFVNHKISPFVDLRVGCNVIDSHCGIYAYMGAGIRIKRVSLSTGWSYHGYNTDWYNDMSYISLRVGFEF